MTAARPWLQFLLVAAAVVAAETMVLASRAYIGHPEAMSFAVAFDICLGLPFAWWLLVVRRGAAPMRTMLRAAVVSIGLCAFLLQRDLRLLAVPFELGAILLVILALRRGRAAEQGPVLRAIASELSMLWYGLFSWPRRPPPGFTAYKRAGWVAIHSALVMCVVAEAIPLHFLLLRWGAGAAAAGAALHAYSILWLLGDLQALRLRPIQVEGGVLHLRIGLRWEAEIPLSEIAAVERSGAGLKLGVLGTPNFLLRLKNPVELRGPLGLRRRSDSLALQVDDPDGLERALR
jgi:hypothetical protein